MIGDTALREIIGTDFLGAVSGSDLALSCLCLCIMALLALQIIEFCTQQCEGFFFILQL